MLLLEVGLGGRLDATNVIDRPLASIITPVSVDHTKFLGDTVEVIAIEKAGVLKRNVPADHRGADGLVRDVIEACAARVRAPLHISGQDWQAREERGRLVFEDENGLLDLPLPRLPGRHQFENAGAPIATLRALPVLGVTRAHIEAGLQTVEWPARLQRITKGRLLDLLPPESELWLDGGHNPDGGRVVASDDGGSGGEGRPAAGACRGHAQHQGFRGLFRALRRAGGWRTHRADHDKRCGAERGRGGGSG